MEEQEETILTHEGYLRNAIMTLLRDCETVRMLSSGRNRLMRKTIAELEEVCSKVLKELEEYPSRATMEDWKKRIRELEY